MLPEMRARWRDVQNYADLRHHLTTALSDADLGMQLGENMPTLENLCIQMGQIEQCYIDSLLTFRQDFSLPLPQVEPVRGSTSALSSWYTHLDSLFEAALERLAPEDLPRQIDRGGGFRVTPDEQLRVYTEALLIFYGKVSIYLQVAGKSVSPKWLEWIG